LRRWIGFSEDDDRNDRRSRCMKDQAATPHVQRVEDIAFHQGNGEKPK